MWINYNHINYGVEPGRFGGAKCMCPQCAKGRVAKMKLEEKKRVREGILKIVGIVLVVMTIGALCLSL